MSSTCLRQAGAYPGSAVGPGYRTTEPRIPGPRASLRIAIYFAANNFSNNCSERRAPSSDSHTDLFFVAGSEM